MEDMETMLPMTEMAKLSCGSLMLLHLKKNNSIRPGKFTYNCNLIGLQILVINSNKWKKTAELIKILYFSNAIKKFFCYKNWII